MGIRQTSGGIDLRDMLEVIHESFRVLNRVLDDIPMKPFSEAEPWQVEIGMRVARVLMRIPDVAVSARMVHELWYEEMYRDGWRAGNHKDADRKLHPNMRHWETLEPEQQAKTHLYLSHFRAMAPIVITDRTATADEAGNKAAGMRVEGSAVIGEIHIHQGVEPKGKMK